MREPDSGGLVLTVLAAVFLASLAALVYQYDTAVQRQVDGWFSDREWHSHPGGGS